MVIFKSEQKKFEIDLKIKLCGERLSPTESVKYLTVKIDVNLSWQCPVNDLSIKLKRVNAILFKIRKNVSPKLLRSFTLLFLTPTYPTVFLSGLRILVLFNGF